MNPAEHSIASGTTQVAFGEKAPGPYMPRIHADYGAFEATLRQHPDIDLTGLFVVGSARSGTTILQECLNVSPQVYVLGEANLALNFWRADFMDWYNAMHHGFGNHRSKSTRALNVGGAANFIGEFLTANVSRFRYVGEKIAFGPHGLYDGFTHQETVFQFHERFFYRSKYYFIIRRPDETIESMSRMFRSRPLGELIEVWIRSAALYVDMLVTFPHVHLVLFERLNGETIDLIGAQLQEDLSAARDLLDMPSRATIHTAIDDERYSNVAPVLRLCWEIYRLIEDGVSSTTFRVREGLSRRKFVARLRETMAMAPGAFKAHSSRHAGTSDSS